MKIPSCDPSDPKLESKRLQYNKFLRIAGSSGFQRAWARRRFVELYGHRPLASWPDDAYAEGYSFAIGYDESEFS